MAKSLNVAVAAAFSTAPDPKPPATLGRFRLVVVLRFFEKQSLSRPAPLYRDARGSDLRQFLVVTAQFDRGERLLGEPVWAL